MLPGMCCGQPAAARGRGGGAVPRRRIAAGDRAPRHNAQHDRRFRGRDYSWRSASIGVSRDARRAG